MFLFLPYKYHNIICFCCVFSFCFLLLNITTSSISCFSHSQLHRVLQKVLWNQPTSLLHFLLYLFLVLPTDITATFSVFLFPPYKYHNIIYFLFFTLTAVPSAPEGPIEPPDITAMFTVCVSSLYHCRICFCCVFCFYFLLLNIATSSISCFSQSQLYRVLQKVL